jgi:hypothetical protein
LIEDHGRHKKAANKISGFHIINFKSRV